MDQVFGIRNQIFRVGSCAINFQAETVLALNKKMKVNWNFHFYI